MQQTHAHADAVDATGWPTTLRFSRHLGEATRGPEYAIAIEGPPLRRVSHAPWTHRALRMLGLGSLVALDEPSRTP